MEININSEKENPLLKRREVHFTVKHNQRGATPPRQEVRNAIAKILKKKADLVFVERLETRTGTRVATGSANIYETKNQALLVERKYIVKRNAPPQENVEKEE